jgi:hypothetical protein
LELSGLPILSDVGVWRVETNLAEVIAKVVWIGNDDMIILYPKIE